MRQPKGVNDLLYFLTTSHRGYCEQFAGTMAVLLRALGLPARVAVGFTPGHVPERHPLLRRHHAERAQLGRGGVPGYGWLAFEPTPTRSNPVASLYDAPS